MGDVNAGADDRGADADAAGDPRLMNLGLVMLVVMML